MKYFIAYNVEGRRAEILNKIREEVAEKFEVTEALNFPPHLTLFPPFEMEMDRLRELGKELEKVAAEMGNLKVKTKGFNYFDQAVWYVDVEQKQELMDLKDVLVEMMEREFSISPDRKRGTHFHVTIAYKDLTVEKFKLIGEFLSKIKLEIENFEIDSISLLQQENERWLEVAKFKLSNS